MSDEAKESSSTVTQTVEPVGLNAPGSLLRDKGLPKDHKVGRFEIVQLIGEGGMGRIYEAYDPQLGRRIALKLLLDESAERHRARLIPEAKALARLGHPNVVTVHDAGSHGGSVFIAMELVKGGTLADWCEEHPADGSQARTNTALRLLIDAARGIIAAHEAGLVHRDVKPSNILIGEDGRVRVADFGIARINVAAEANPQSSTTRGDASSSDLTATGVTVGTPAYMAPEQFSGDAEPSSDQFSFCVAAWEVLYGERPFKGRTLSALSAAISLGELHRPHGIKLDPKLDAILRKGLACEQSSRHESMASMVDALVGLQAPRSSSSKTRLATLLGGVAAIATVAVYGLSSNDAVCEGGADMFARTWNPQRRSKVEDAILAVDSKAAGTWSTFARWVDDYAANWTAAHTEVCEATQVHGAQSKERMEQRLDCLDIARREVDTLLQSIEQGGGVQSALEVSQNNGVTEPRECGEDGLLDAADAVVNPGVVAGLMRAFVLHRQGRFDEALETIETTEALLPEEARSRTAGRVALLHARMLYLAGRGAESEELFRRAYAIGRRLGAPRIQGDAAVGLALALESTHKPIEEVRTWREAAQEVWGDKSQPHDEWLVRLVRAKSTARELGPSAGLAEYESLLKFSEEHDIKRADAREHLAAFLSAWQYDPKRAVALSQEAVELKTSQYGESSPRLVRPYSISCNVVATVGRAHNAVSVCKNALSRLEKIEGVSQHSLADIRVDLAGVYIEQGEFGRAKEVLNVLASHEAMMRPSLRRRYYRRQRSLFAQDSEQVSDEVIREWRQATLDSSPNNFAFRFVSSVDHVQWLWHSGRYSEAKREAELVKREFSIDEIVMLARTPDEYFAAGTLVGVMTEWRDYETAVELGERLIEDIGAPMPGTMWHASVGANLCSVYLGLDRLEDAKRVCEEVIDTVQSQPRVLIAATINLGVAYFNGGELDEADAAYKRALKLLETRDDLQSTAIVHANIGEVAERQGRFDDAVAEYERSLELLLSRDPAPLSLVFAGVGLVRSLAAQGNGTKAKEIVRMLEERVPKDDLLGRGQVAEADADLRGRKPRVRALERALRLYDRAGAIGEVERLCAVETTLMGCELALGDNSTRE